MSGMGGMGGMMGGGGGAGMMGGNPWMKLIEGGTKLGDAQAGGSGGKDNGNGMLGKIGARSNMPKEAIMGLASGGFQMIQANKLKKRAEGAYPGMIDPRQASFLSELNQKRKAIDTGADFASGMASIDTTQAGTNENIVRAGGGDAGGVMQALLQAQRGAGQSKNQVLAEGQGQQQFYNSMYNDLNNKIAARRLQLQMQRSQQLKAEWAQKQQVANQNLMAGVAGLMEQKQNYGKPAVENTAATTNTPTINPGTDPNSGFNTGWDTLFKKKAENTTPPDQVKTITMDPKQTENMPVTSAKNMLNPGGSEFLMNLGKK